MMREPFCPHADFLAVRLGCVRRLLREETHEQLVIGAKMFGGMMAAALVLGWLMLPFPI